MVRTVDTASPWYVPGVALTVLAGLLIGMCGFVAGLSHLQYARSQALAYAELRYELARATAPVGQTFTDVPESDTPGAGEPVDAGEEPDAEPQARELLHPLGTPVALLTAEAAGLRDVVVLEGTTSGVTAGGPGHERNSVMPGQEGWSLLYGRAWSHGAPFRGITDLAPGDEVTLTTGQGVHTYEVTGLRRPGQPLPRREPGQGRLVLGTAEGSPFVPQSVVYVDALLTSEVQPVPARRMLALGPGEKIMAGDTSSWPTILLWAQGLAASAFAVAWARRRWGRPQAWVVGVPLLTLTGLGTFRALTLLLPNLL
ncbi:MAG: sortase domain-bontaining protein [Actinomycetes bacterium]